MAIQTPQQTEILIVFQSGTAPQDRAIQLVEEAQGAEARAVPRPLPNHAFLVATDGIDLAATGTGETLALEAAPPAARLFDLAARVASGAVLRPYVVSCTQEQAAAVRAGMLAAVGRPYAFDALLTAVLQVATGHAEDWVGDPTARADCIELAVSLLRDAGIPSCGETPAYDLTPVDGEADALARGDAAAAFQTVVTITALPVAAPGAPIAVATPIVSAPPTPAAPDHACPGAADAADAHTARGTTTRL